MHYILRFSLDFGVANIVMAAGHDTIISVTVRIETPTPAL